METIQQAAATPYPTTGTTTDFWSAFWPNLAANISTALLIALFGVFVVNRYQAYKLKKARQAQIRSDYAARMDQVRAVLRSSVSNPTTVGRIDDLIPAQARAISDNISIQSLNEWRSALDQSPPHLQLIQQINGDVARTRDAADQLEAALARAVPRFVDGLGADRSNVNIFTTIYRARMCNDTMRDTLLATGFRTSATDGYTKELAELSQEPDLLQARNNWDSAMSALASSLGELRQQL
jgi:hypothetical protein